MGTQRPCFSHNLLDTTPARTILVYRNGDKFYVGKKFVINRKRVPSFEALMTQLNEKVAVPFGVRRLYTPCNGHLVQDLEELQQGGKYVAAGRERFRKLDYFHIAPRKPTKMKKVKEIRPVVHSDMIVPSRWQIFHRKPRHISVFTNGNLFIPPAKLIIPRFTLYDWDNVLAMIGEKVHPHSGGVRRLYTMDGLLLDGSSELIDHHYYVASGLEAFKHLPYWETQKVPHDIKKRYAEFEKIQRRKRKVGSTRPFGIKPVEEELKEVVDHPLYEEIQKNSKNSVYYAKIEQKPSYTEPLTLRGAEGDVYQARTPRKETQGALYVKDDKNVKIDLPVDQRPAEEIKDDEDIFDIISDHDAKETEEERAYEEIERKGNKKGWPLKMFGFFFRPKVKEAKSDTSLKAKERLLKQPRDQIQYQESQLTKGPRHPGQQTKYQGKPYCGKKELLYQAHWPWDRK
ncbi:doublecortin domain-containing protein 2C isoform X1 [Trichosurus vulpecula]|uniref:doublecortin domain-containing protein 2C isoform X1 n=1 Tax=Trichosurus vulpecula TaxID=9337 RepID=UPI00186B06B8|nr:doublecortin domain-containing protein 2C isoform X1 [Trichosurus vulpecula]